jgi:hypothetical protein
MARNATVEPETPETTDEAHAALVAEVEASVPADRPEDATLAQAILIANKELEEKAEVLGRLQSSRMLTTLLVEKGVGSREQVLWVKQYLPRKKRKSNGAEDETSTETDDE